MKSLVKKDEYLEFSRIILNNIIEMNEKFQYYQGFHTLVAVALNLYENLEDAY